jgi:hypothetical protein
VIGDPQFQLDEFKEFLDPYRDKLADYVQSSWPIVTLSCSKSSIASATRLIA